MNIAAVVKQRTPLVLFTVSLCFLTIMQPLAAIGQGNAGSLSPSLVTPAMLETKIAETEAAVGLKDEDKTRLVELYRKALSNLEAANANSAGAAAFQEATQTAPEQTLLIREQIEAAGRTDPLENLDLSLENPLKQLEQQLKKEQADLASAEARRADFEKRLMDEEIRLTAIRERLAEAKQQQEEVAAALRVKPTADEDAVLSQTRRWEQETRYAALSAEIKMLDQELLSRPMRVDLLKAKQEKESSSVAWIGKRVKKLDELVNRKRLLDAEQAQSEAEKAQRETEGLDPLLVSLAEQNARLTEHLTAETGQLDTLDREREQVEELAERIAADYKDARTTLETGGLPRGVGQLLVQQRLALPKSQQYELKARTRQEKIVEMGARRLHYREEARRIANLDETIAQFEAQLSTENTPQMQDRLRELVTQRQTLLQKALEADDFYLAQLRHLDAAERKLIDVTREYDDFLNEHLLWLRGVDPLRLKDLSGLPDEIRQQLSLMLSSDLPRIFFNQVIPSPLFWLALLVTLVLRWKQRRLIEAIEATSTRLGKVATDKFVSTLRALALTLLAAASWPMLLAGIGWTFLLAAQGADLPYALGSSLVRVAEHLFLLRALRMMCIPQGLAAAHFRWPESSVGLLRTKLKRLSWVYAPAMFVFLFAYYLNPVERGGTIGRLGLLVFYAALALFFFRVFHPKQGVLSHLRLREEAGLFFRSYHVWYALLLMFPLGMMVGALAGYVYSIVTMSSMFLRSLGMIAGLLVLYAFALRWLLLVRRRLAYEAAVARRQAALAEKQAAESEAGAQEGGSALSALQIEEPEVDLASLSDDTWELLRISAISSALLGLYLLWSPLFPALRIFDDIPLWHRSVAVGGAIERLPITLADIGLVLIYAVATVVLSKRLPAVLEIILLRRFDMQAGSRYTITTLSAYAVIAAGILLMLNTLGFQWSQLQWLVAALGVGIGFGLQEIVANFISGVIILFEHPVRIGDIVTVGDTSGVVTNIRIRATTIRNWDRQELLVPNKEFITGRLLNWSLSDQMTRVVVTVGVAYRSDVDTALALMKEAAEEHEHVLDDPPPLLSFEGFGENSLTLILRAHLGSLDYRIATITDLHKAINRKFAEAGIAIAFPQRDLHLDTSEPLRISIEETRQETPCPP